jgi:NAD(P)H-dependent FMN reductase
MHARRVVAVDERGRVETVAQVPGRPSGLGWLPDGRLLVVSMEDRKLLRFDGRTLATHADLSALAAHEVNDLVVDAGGRAYVSQFGFDFHHRAAFAKTEILAVEPSGLARPAAGELAFPNGMVIAPDGRTLIVGESYAARLTAFDVARDGGLSARRVFAQLEGAVPDGICLDAEGAAAPPAVADLRAQLAAADAALLCTPEYAFGMPGVLKNAIDWLVSSGELNGKPVAALSASPSVDGGSRALRWLRETLSAIDARVPDEASFPVPTVRLVVTGGELTDAATAEKVRAALLSLERAARKA